MTMMTRFFHNIIISVFLLLLRRVLFVHVMYPARSMWCVCARAIEVRYTHTHIYFKHTALSYVKNNGTQQAGDTYLSLQNIER